MELFCAERLRVTHGIRVTAAPIDEFPFVSKWGAANAAQTEAAAIVRSMLVPRCDTRSSHKLVRTGAGPAGAAWLMSTLVLPVGPVLRVTGQPPPCEERSSTPSTSDDGVTVDTRDPSAGSRHSSEETRRTLGFPDATLTDVSVLRYGQHAHPYRSGYSARCAVRHQRSENFK